MASSAVTRVTELPDDLKVRFGLAAFAQDPARRRLIIDDHDLHAAPQPAASTEGAKGDSCSTGRRTSATQRLCGPWRRLKLAARAEVHLEPLAHISEPDPGRVDHARGRYRVGDAHGQRVTLDSALN